jgi:hypothetical protein
MARYPSGQPVRLSTTIRDATGALANSTVVLSVKKPDATFQAYNSPVNDSTGQYHQDVPATDLAQIGRYQYVWTSTGAAPGVTYGGLSVFDPFEVAILSLQDAKAAVNIPQAVTVYDDELAEMVATIESMIERLIGGPVITRQITEATQPESDRFAIVVRQRPIVNLISIHDNYSGVTYTSTDPMITQADIDPNSGVINQNYKIPFLLLGTCDVVYTAGLGTAVPPAISLASKIIIQHLWETQRGPSAQPGVGGDEMAITLAGFAVPNRALEVLAPYLLEAYV